MIKCLVVQAQPHAAESLVADLESVGIHVIGAVQRNSLVQEASRLGPDVVVAQEAIVSDGLLSAAALLQAGSPCPFVLFTGDTDVEKMARALVAGVHAYEVHGYGVQRLRAVIHLAQVRWAHERRLREALADVSDRFEERKLVDRAKGILMRARQVSEDEAFRVLRAASMHSHQRVGQVSQQVIAAAGHAEAVNRAGQLRMLSQRLVKLHALRSIAGDALLAESVRHVEANIASLDKSLSKATHGDLIDAVRAPWSALRAALTQPGGPAALADVDGHAERMLLQADRLVCALEAGAMMASLHVINVSGRQRMLSQRVAKQALLATMLGGTAAARAREEGENARSAFEEAMVYLRSVPLSSPDIVDALQAAARAWTALSTSLALERGSAGQRDLLDASEALLTAFEQLTERYERSMQILMG